MDKQSTASEFQGMLEARGVSRRSFMKLCGTLAVMAGLGEAAAPRVAQALEESVIGASQGDLYPVIWIEGASCTGCTEAFAQIAQLQRDPVRCCGPFDGKGQGADHRSRQLHFGV